MAFNAATYRRNKWRREALEYLAEARRQKAEGGRYCSASVGSYAKRARITWALYLSQRRICRMNGTPDAT